MREIMKCLRILSTIPLQSVYDILGNHVIDIVDRYHQKGMFKTTWNGNDKNNIKVSSGVYYYIITAGNFIQKRKMTLLK